MMILRNLEVDIRNLRWNLGIRMFLRTCPFITRLRLIRAHASACSSFDLVLYLAEQSKSKKR
jgi:hypothetical protein